MRGPDRRPLLWRWLCDRAGRFPTALAVVEEQRTLALGELAARADRVAAALVRRGLEPGNRVVLLLEKGADAITALFGTLAAGGVYVPIPPSWPAARIQSAIEACGARFLVRESDHESAGRLLLVDNVSGATTRWEDCLSETPVARPQTGGADEPAFILFTSGSSGSPKGVTISHQAVAAFVAWSAEAFDLGPSDRVACPAQLSFDLSTLDVFNIAWSAAAAVILPPALLLLPRRVAPFLREHGVTVWYSVPSVLVRLLEEGDIERHPPEVLRVVLFAGEVMPPLALARLRAAMPGVLLANLYGPTETNVVTWHRVGDAVARDRAVPIGVPCPYARVALDPATEEGDGERRAGELLVAGQSLMSGYWNRPDETRRAFVEVREADGCSTRFYRTGDRVAIGPDGVIDFIGRIDRQIKRRGFRVEPDEIEEVLSRHPQVAEAAVLVAGPPERPELRAYVRPTSGAPADALALRALCASQLPAYMMPDRILFLDAMPRGGRGKIDYRALEACGVPEERDGWTSARS